MGKRHIGIIALDFRLLLEILDFNGGKIHRVYTPEGYPEPERCYIMLEHPDLPEVPIHTLASEITITFRKSIGEYGGVIKVERVDPPKHPKVKSAPRQNT